MAPPDEIRERLQLKFPKPLIDIPWFIKACHYLEDSEGIPALVSTDNVETVERYYQRMEYLVLNASFKNTMKKGTGLPPGINRSFVSTVLKGPIVLELVHMMEIGVSAFTLEKHRVERDKTTYDLMQAAATKEKDRGCEYEDVVNWERSLPPYPKRRLRLFFSDGEIELEAVEYKPLADFHLGDPDIIGTKVRLENIQVIEGVAYLEPQGVRVLGGSVVKAKAAHLTRLREELFFKMRDELHVADEHDLSCLKLYNAKERSKDPKVSLYASL